MKTKQKLNKAIKEHNKLLKSFQLSPKKISIDKILNLDEDKIAKSLDEIYDLYTSSLVEEVRK